MLKFKEFISEESKGTYAGVRFSDKTKTAIKKFIKENNIPNSLDIDKSHCTLLFSRKYCPDFKARGELVTPLIGNPTKFEVWDTSDDKHALVLKFKSEDLENRHNELMSTHKATYDYDEYKTHVTFSYDVGKEFDVNSLPNFKVIIEIVEEYQEDLKLNWQNSK